MRNNIFEPNGHLNQLNVKHFLVCLDHIFLHTSWFLTTRHKKQIEGIALAYTYFSLFSIIT